MPKKKHIAFILIILVFLPQTSLNQTKASVRINQSEYKEYRTNSDQNISLTLDTEFSTKSSSNNSWTYMLYLDADNDIESDAIRDFEWLEQAGGSDENVSFVVLLDRIRGYDNTHGNWNGSRIYNVTKNLSGQTFDSQLMVDLGEVDMADPDTLTDFITYCFENFPAENYVLDLWDHGHAAYGVIDDETSSSHFIINDVQTAISNALSLYPEEEIDILSMDACDMMTIEVAWEMRNLCKFFIASETGTNGYPYKLIANALKSTPNMNASSVCLKMVNAYASYYGLHYYACLSVINQSKLLTITENFNSFLTELMSTLENGSFNELFRFTRDLSLDFYDGHWVDLVTLIENVRVFLNVTTINLKASELLLLLDEIILYNWQGNPYLGKANGLTIYMPFEVTSNDYFTDYINRNSFCTGMDWQLDSLWDEFIAFYKNHHLTTSPDIPILNIDETLEDCSIQQDSILLFKVSFWKRTVYDFSCQINSGDVDFQIWKYDIAGIHAYIGGSFLINPEDGNTEQSRLYLLSGFYLIMVSSNTATANFDIKVQYDDLIDLVCNSPHTSTGGSTIGDDQGHFKQDLRHYFQIEIPYGNNSITLTNSETARYQLIIYDGYWWVECSFASDDFGETITFVYNHTNENSTTFILEIYAYWGVGDFTIEVLNPNEPTPKANIPIWQLILFIPIIYLIFKIKPTKKSNSDINS